MKTLALVIGNNKYEGDSKLDNAVNDAKSISETFEKLNYEVIFKDDCTSNQYGDILTEFESKITDFDASIFYFAGHGFQFEGENYLASIECPVEQPNKHICERTCIRLTEITDIIKKSPTKVNIIIIDACRKSFGRGSTNSFTQINAPEGTIIAFSTSPGDGAKDAGMEGHSLYTGALLKYIGRELLSVEELFKKVRKTVYNLSGGAQTSWEHTSLVGDFYFNTGQMVHSASIPYDESVVKDRTFISKGDNFGNIISDLQSCDWNKQNPAVNRFSSIQPNTLDKNQLFLIGRNMLQAGGYAHNASDFLWDLESNLIPYFTGEDNHLLNGILFEIYFDNNGDFRNGNFKRHSIDSIFKLRHLERFHKSFEFLNNALAPFKDNLFYIPTIKNVTIDVDVLAKPESIKNWNSEEEEYQVIESITVLDKDITKEIGQISESGNNSEYLIKMLSNYLLAPKELIQLNENIAIKKMKFDLKETIDWDF